MTTDTKFNLISYKPSSEYNTACHCHPEYQTYNAELSFHNNLSEAELEQTLFEQMARDLDHGEEAFQFGIYANGIPIYSSGSEMYGFTSGYETDDGSEEEETRYNLQSLCEVICDRAAEKAKIRKEERKQEEERAKLAAAAAQSEREKKEREERDRKQYEALKAKFETK